MNTNSFAETPEPPAPKPRTRRSIGCLIVLVTLGLMASGVIAVAVAARQALRLGPDARDLRDVVQEHFEQTGTWHEIIELKLGPLACAIGREIAIRAADDPDATALLRTARSLECGVYRVGSGRNGAELLRNATRTMSARGWARIVAVVDDSTTIAVFTWRDESAASGEIEFGAVVHEDDVVVVAIARAEVAALLELVERHLPARDAIALER